MPDPSRSRKPPQLRIPEAPRLTERDRAEFTQAVAETPPELLGAVRDLPSASGLPSPSALLRELQSGKRRVRDDSTVSLRQRTQEEARQLLESFLRARRAAGDRFVMVIHGKGYRSPEGRAVLAPRVPEWLAGWKPELVATWGEARREDGGSGALYVVFDRAGYAQPFRRRGSPAGECSRPMGPMDPTRESRRSRPTGAAWDPEQYQRFGDHRFRPALELLHRVPVADASLVYDLGCGAGTVTRIIAERFPTARVIGLDSSPEMLAKASAEPNRIEWVRADIADWKPECAPQLIYSNAVLHWLQHHPTLFPRLLGYLAPRGCLAVQMPLSHSQPSHLLMCETLANGGAGGSPLGDEALAAAAAREWVLDSGAYYELLAPQASALDIWETEYFHRLEGEDAVLEWVRATGLRPVLNGLDGADLERFIEVYRERLRAAYPRRADGNTVYPFRRLFLVATRRD